MIHETYAERFAIPFQKGKIIKSIQLHFVLKEFRFHNIYIYIYTYHVIRKTLQRKAFHRCFFEVKPFIYVCKYTYNVDRHVYIRLLRLLVSAGTLVLSKHKRVF